MNLIAAYPVFIKATDFFTLGNDKMTDGRSGVSGMLYSSGHDSYRT